MSEPERLALAKKLVGDQTPVKPIKPAEKSQKDETTNIDIKEEKKQPVKEYLIEKEDEKKGKVKVTDLLKKHRLKLFLPLFAALGAFILITSTFIFGWDQAWWNTRFDGKINIPSGQSEIIAEVEFQGKYTTTKSDGSFYFDNIRFGQHPIRISAKNFRSLEQTVTVNRFGGFSYFNLQYVDSSSVQAKIKASNNSTITRDGLTLRIGKNTVSLNDDGTLNIQNIGVDEQKLEISSPFYVDRAIPLSLKPGENLLPDIVLEPAVDVSVQVTNWLFPTKNIEKAKVTAFNKDIVSNTDGVANLTDVPVNSDIKLSIFADGFNLLETTVNSKNPTSKIQLVPTGSVVYGSEKEGKRQLYKAHLDGIAQTPIVQNFGDVYWFSQKGSDIIFQGNGEQIQNPEGRMIPQFFKVALNGGSINRISRFFDYYGFSNGWVTETFLPDQTAILQTYQNYYTNTAQLRISDAFGQNIQNIIEISKPGYNLSINQQIISPDGKKIAFVYQQYRILQPSAVPEPVTTQLITINKDGSNTSVVENIVANNLSIELIGFSANSQSILYHFSDQNTNEIRSINPNGSNKKSITNALPTYKTYTITEDGYYFASERDGKTNIYRIKPDFSAVEQLTNQKNVTYYRIDQTNNIFLFATNEGNFIVPLQAITQTPIQTNISTNYTGWIGTKKPTN